MIMVHISLWSTMLVNPGLVPLVIPGLGVGIELTQETWDNPKRHCPNLCQHDKRSERHG